MFFQRARTNTWHIFFTYLYLVLVTLSGFIAGVAFCFTPKPDTTAVAFLAFLDGAVNLFYATLTNTEKGSNLSQGQLPKTYSSSQRTRSRRCGYGVLRIGNRILMVLHSLLVLISVAGAIELAIAYRYSNP